jgi:hypothetical protein
MYFGMYKYENGGTELVDNPSDANLGLVNPVVRLRDVKEALDATLTYEIGGDTENPRRFYWKAWT